MNIIFFYLQSLFGVRHDDYDYAEINVLIERALKQFIKSAGCYPERVTKKEYDRVMREFKHSEKVRILLTIIIPTCYVHIYILFSYLCSYFLWSLILLNSPLLGSTIYYLEADKQSGQIDSV